MSAPGQQLMPLLGWELGMQQAPSGEMVIIVVANTVVGPIQFYVRAEDAEKMAEGLTIAIAKVREPQLLRPTSMLMGPDGQPLVMPSGPVSSNGLGPLQEQIPDETDEDS